MDNNIEINSHKHQGRGDSLIRIDMEFFKHCYPMGEGRDNTLQRRVNVLGKKSVTILPIKNNPATTYIIKNLKNNLLGLPTTGQMLAVSWDEPEEYHHAL